MMNEEMRENAEKKSSDKVPDASSNIPILDKVVKKELPPNNGSGVYLQFFLSVSSFYALFRHNFNEIKGILERTTRN